MRGRMLILLTVALVAGIGLAAWRLWSPVVPPVPAGAVPIAVPSGMAVYYEDTVQNEPGSTGLTYRFRFIAPSIAGTEGGAAVQADMQACATGSVWSGSPRPGRSRTRSSSR